MPEPNSPALLQSLAGRPVLVTGATGFIGRHLVRRLVALGAEVHAGTRRRPEDVSFGPDSPSVTCRQVDLADRDAVLALYDDVRPDVVFHLASRVAGSRDLELVHPTLSDNLCSTVHLLEAAARHGCERFVQVGSLEEPAEGDGVAVPSSPYAAAKAAASTYCRMFHQLYAVPVVRARVFMVYGPGPQDENKLVPYVIRSLLDGETPSFSSGTRPVDWIHVDDVVEGFLRLAVTPGLEDRLVDLGTGTLHTVRDMVEQLFTALDADTTPSFGGRNDRAQEQIRRADVERTRELLGWAPGIDVKDGVEQTVAWFRSHPRSKPTS